MKGKGRTVVIHPRSIRRTFLGRVVSGRAGGVGGGGGGGGAAAASIRYITGAFTSPPCGHPSPLSLSKAVFPRSLFPFFPSPQAHLQRPEGASLPRGPLMPPLSALARKREPPFLFLSRSIFNPLFFLPSPRLARLTRRPMQRLSTRQISRKRNTISKKCVSLVKSEICVKISLGFILLISITP